jgi:3-(3-hydroxy-phenyl)propionate hydroxylase
VLSWNNDPRKLLGNEVFERWKAIGATFVSLRPMTQLHWTVHDDPDVVIVGDRTGALKSWFDVHAESVVFLRPDRCIAGSCIAQLAPDLSEALFDVLHVVEGGDVRDVGEHEVDDGAVLHVAQSAAQSARTITRTP